MTRLPPPLPTAPQRDHAARVADVRRARMARAAGLSRRKRQALVLLAAIAVPALAAPGDWSAFAIGNAGRSRVELEPMPFERPGESFPGSAFYYLAQDKTASIAPGTGAPLVDLSSGPIARALSAGGSSLDRWRALECLTAAIYYEAASEPDQGQRAVAQVVLNRVAHPAFPKTVCGVVYQGSERTTGCQFTFTCDGSLARAPSRFFWLRAQTVARAALAGAVEPSVGLATHYHTIAVHPAWDAQMNHIATIGAHMFFSWRGRAGDAGAFRFAYGGGEPVAAPHQRNATADRQADPALDPLALQRAYEAGLGAAMSGSPRPAAGSGDGAASVQAAPRYASEVQQRGGDALYRGDNLPQSQGVRPEYQQSGRWLKQPGT